MIMSDEILAQASEGSLELKTSLKYAIHKGYVHEGLGEAVRLFLNLEKQHPNTYRLETWMYCVKAAHESGCASLIGRSFEITKALLDCDISKLQFEHAHLLMGEVYRCPWTLVEKIAFLEGLSRVFQERHQKISEPLVLLVYHTLTHLKRHGQAFTAPAVNRRIWNFFRRLNAQSSTAAREAFIAETSVFLGAFEVASDPSARKKLFKTYTKGDKLAESGIHVAI